MDPRASDGFIAYFEVPCNALHRFARAPLNAIDIYKVAQGGATRPRLERGDIRSAAVRLLSFFKSSSNRTSNQLVGRRTRSCRAELMIPSFSRI
jgi:hypothetical protein